MERRIVDLIITGFSGTGKSLVAREVARRLNWDLVDTDDEIVKLAGKPISEIFQKDGESKFREMERAAIEKACRQKQSVISIGGGAIVDPQNRETLGQSGLIICLEAKAETIYERLFREAANNPEIEVRPLLAAKNPLERIKQLKTARQPYYADVDWTVHTDGLSIGKVAEEVIRAWRLLGSASDDTPIVIARHEMPVQSQEYLEPGLPRSARNNVRDVARNDIKKAARNDDKDIACEVKTATQSYPIYVGYSLLDKLGEKMKQNNLSGTCIIISDETVFSLYGGKVETILKDAGFTVRSFVVPPGETTKSIDSAVRIYDFLVEHRVERDDIIVALGGGVIGDLAGFIAATFLRGIRWIQVPTSLVAMVDASIGGKVGINHPEGKNLIGAFYQPRLVLADVQTLSSLPQRELTSGWAEVIKHGLILDESYVQFLEDNADSLKRLEPDVLTKAVARSAAIKAQVVSEDEKEAGKRIILNYGHTIAHGLEAATKYEQFLHGEAVAIGMVGADRLSQRLGLLSSAAVERQQTLLQKFGLPTSLRAERSNLKLSVADVTKAMKLDKKIKKQAIRWVLLQDIGKVVVRSDVPQQDVLAVLEELTQS